MKREEIRKATGMKVVVFSDLDATLLDAETYSWRPAEEAIDALKKRGAAIILVTSKTLSEVALLHDELGLEDPFILENGGGIAACKGMPLLEYLISREPKLDESYMEDFVVFPLGMRYEMLVRLLAEISAEVGIPVLGFSAMSDEGVADATGLKDLVDGAPSTVLQGVSKEAAEDAKTKLEAEGATVQVK